MIYENSSINFLMNNSLFRIKFIAIYTYSINKAANSSTKREKINLIINNVKQAGLIVNIKI